MKTLYSAQEALNTLLEGNKRYQSKDLIFNKLCFEKRTKLSIQQSPIAVILSCSDSRVPLEIIFNQPHGNLFVIRVAGNILDKLVLGSIEFALFNLNVKLVMILGHSECGAIKATLENYTNSKSAIKNITEAIKPALTPELYNNIPITSETIKKAATAHVKYVATQLLQTSSIIQENSNEIKIVPAYYNIRTGKVAIL